MKSWSFAFNVREQQCFPAHYIMLIINSPAGGLFLCFYKDLRWRGSTQGLVQGNSLLSSSASNLEQTILHGAMKT